MAVKEITKYQTDDGKLFDTLGEAQGYVTQDSLQNDIYSFTNYGTHDSRDIAEFIFATYSLTRKVGE